MSRILLGGDGKLGFAQLERLTWDTRVLEADVMIPQLRLEVNARDLPAPRLEAAEAAVDLLESWNRRAGVDSEATTLYFFWRFNMRQLGIDDPVAALERALGYMQQTYGTWRVAWGEVNRLQRRHTSGQQPFDPAAASLPIAGGPGNPFGTIFNFYARPEEGQEQMFGIAGHSFVGLVEFGDTPRSKSVLVFGADADAESPHYFDQAQLFAERRYKDAWFRREAVEANAQSTLTLTYNP